MTAPPPKKALKPRPIRDTTYQVEMRRKVLAKLPRYPDTACTARRVADAVGVYVAVIRDALNALKATGKADFRLAPIRGGTHALWWRTDAKISPEI